MAVGDILKGARQRENWTIEKAAHSLGIAVRYIKSLENNDYSALPGKIYTKNFIKKYAELLNLNPKSLLIQYLQEEKKQIISAKDNTRSWFVQRLAHLRSTPHFLRQAIALTLIAILLIYLGLELKGIFSPPPLNLINPLEGLVNTEANLLVKGWTLPETNVQINGRQVVSSVKGLFEEQINLQLGLNVITVTAIKKHGQSTTVVRNVIYNKITNDQ